MHIQPNVSSAFDPSEQWAPNVGSSWRAVLRVGTLLTSNLVADLPVVGFKPMTFCNIAIFEFDMKVNPPPPPTRLYPDIYFP